VSKCPWYVTAHAVRQYMAIRRLTSFDDSSDELIEYAAATWRRYVAETERQPKVTRTGAYMYRGPGPLRLTLIVSAENRPEGPKQQVVDVLPTHAGMRGRR